MAKRQLEKVRTVYYCSSSIANFRDKLHKRLGLEVWHWWKNRNDRVIFFGLYHWKDYLRFIWHRGQKKVFWCGSDILALEKNKFWRFIIVRIFYTKAAKNYVENNVEGEKLLELGMLSEIRPMIFDDPNKYKPSFKPSSLLNVYLSCHVGREKEYGLEFIETIAKDFPEINFHVYGRKHSFHQLWWDGHGRLMNRDYVGQPNIIYHGKVLEEQFNREIKGYQGAVRLNKFDGFAETLAKSILMGQYPISKIWYPKIHYAKDNWEVEMYLKQLKFKKEPNIKGREYWLKVLEESKNEIVNSW